MDDIEYILYIHVYPTEAKHQQMSKKRIPNEQTDIVTAAINKSASLSIRHRRQHKIEQKDEKIGVFEIL